MCACFEHVVLLQAADILLLEITVFTSKMMELNVMREVLNVEESLPVASCSGCGRCVFAASHWLVSVMSSDQENVTQDENVTSSASSVLCMSKLW